MFLRGWDVRRGCVSGSPNFRPISVQNYFLSSTQFFYTFHSFTDIKGLFGRGDQPLDKSRKIVFLHQQLRFSEQVAYSVLSAFFHFFHVISLSHFISVLFLGVLSLRNLSVVKLDYYLPCC